MNKSLNDALEEIADSCGRSGMLAPLILSSISPNGAAIVMRLTAPAGKPKVEALAKTYVPPMGSPIIVTVVDRLGKTSVFTIDRDLVTKQ